MVWQLLDLKIEQEWRHDGFLALFTIKEKINVIAVNRLDGFRINHSRNWTIRLDFG
jgi:hypothetical protein